MKRAKVWEAISYVWTEVGLGREDFQRFAKEIHAESHDMRSFSRAVFWDTCGAFSVETVFAFLLMGIMLPDWYFPEPEQKVERWLRRPLLLSPINLLWLGSVTHSCASRSSIIGSNCVGRLRHPRMPPNISFKADGFAAA
jgi:hypothetical protein